MQIQEKNYKVLLTGQSSCGKTSLINKYFNETQSKQFTPTNCLQHRSKFLTIGDQNINLQVIDTPGSSQYEILRQFAYKGCQVVMFVFDVTTEKSFKFVSQEIELIVEKNLCSYDCLGVLVGINPEGKQRKISYQQAKEAGNAIGQYFEISLKQNQKINNLFHQIVSLRQKFDNQDTEIKSMLEKLYEINPSLLQQKKGQQNPLKNQNTKIKTQQSAAPSNVQQTVGSVNKKEEIIKCLLVGETDTGKSAICLNYTDGQFPIPYLPTIGIDFRIKRIELDDKIYKLQIWDTAGLEKFRALTHCYYKLAKIAFIVYDISNMETFLKVDLFVKDLQTFNEEKLKYVCLVGNKLDLPRTVSQQMGMALAEKYKFDFVEISAKNKDDLQNLFMRGLKYVHEHKKTELQKQI